MFYTLNRQKKNITIENTRTRDFLHTDMSHKNHWAGNHNKYEEDLVQTQEVLCMLL